MISLIELCDDFCSDSMIGVIVGIWEIINIEKWNFMTLIHKFKFLNFLIHRSGILGIIDFYQFFNDRREGWGLFVKKKNIGDFSWPNSINFIFFLFNLEKNMKRYKSKCKCYIYVFDCNVRLDVSVPHISKIVHSKTKHKWY